MQRLTTICAVMLAVVMTAPAKPKIDRQAVVARNCPHITETDILGSLSVGNGRFAVTVDVTGLQSYPQEYAGGVPLGAMSQWGWHAYPNTEGLTEQESRLPYQLHGRESMYAIEHRSEGRGKMATEYFRVNPHRLNLGSLGLRFTDRKGREIALSEIADIDQRLDLWGGVITSKYTVEGGKVEVSTGVSPDADRIFCRIVSPLLSDGRAEATLRFSYPTGKHSDDANDWAAADRHKTSICQHDKHSAVIGRALDDTRYQAVLQWSGDATLRQDGQHTLALASTTDTLEITLEYLPVEMACAGCQPADGRQSQRPGPQPYSQLEQECRQWWQGFWQNGGFVDFGACTDPRAAELERRVVLSQYLTQINCAGDMPPQETGLTYNSWFGRPHLEMTWWHAVDFALWGREAPLARMMDWYNSSAMAAARALAERQGFDGVRWLKMTDPDSGEAPSNTGSFLIWQQPHYIYFAEELYRINPTDSVLDRYAEGVEQTVRFMADYAAACERDGQVRLFGQTAMQEGMTKDQTYDHPYEHAYWVYGLNTAQQWRQRRGLPREAEWDRLISLFQPLRPDGRGIYPSGYMLPDKSGQVAQASSLCDEHTCATIEPFDPYKTPDPRPKGRWSAEEFALKSRSDHPAVLGACGLLPDMGLYDPAVMARTYEWIDDNWEWQTTWGWDYGMTAMAAARLGMPERAVDALLCDRQKNTYLINGHNYQEPKRLRIYLPGNGALLTAVAMMCAGWSGSRGDNPGFPADGTWQVRWEGLRPMQ